MACNPNDMGRLRLKYDRLIVSGRVRCKWMDNNAMTKLQGNAANFGAEIWFPDNVHIDSSMYARVLLDAAARMGTTMGGRRDGEGGENGLTTTTPAVMVMEDCLPMKSDKTIVASLMSSSSSSLAMAAVEDNND
jgi:hypothetical protein